MDGIIDGVTSLFGAALNKVKFDIKDEFGLTDDQLKTK